MKISTLSSKTFLILTLATFLLAGCGSTATDTETESLSLLVEKYHRKDRSVYKDSDRFSAYFDFSDGMLFAYKEGATQEILKSITNKLTGESANCDVFSLASDKVEKLTLHQTALYNEIMDSKSYNNVLNAPIEKALKKIIEEDRSALLITDFEEYTTDGKIQYQNFAKDYFIDWLKKGNDITFFVTDYLEKSQPKHLYYIVFDNPGHRLLGKIEEALEGLTPNYSRFLLSTHAFELSTKYPGALKGGNYHDAAGEDLVTAVMENGDANSYRKFQDIAAEFYPIGETWKHVVANAKAMQEDGVETKFTGLFRNLFIDLSHQDSYIIDRLDVKVYDVQSDFQAFVNYQTALLNKPAQAESGEVYEANEYYDEKGQLLPEYQYQPTMSFPEVVDMFVLNRAIFDSTLKKNREEVELVIDFKPGFSGTVVGMESGDLLKIDIVIAGCEPNYQRLDTLFSWGNNNNLTAAVRNTLQALKPVNKVVYTYYLKSI